MRAALGDGDFVMSLPEMGTAVMNDIPAVFLVQNNRGYMSIRGGQRKFTGRRVASEFSDHKGQRQALHGQLWAKTFGLRAWKVEDSAGLEKTLKAALDGGGPALVEVTTARDAAGPFVTGWRDFPSLAYYEKEQASSAEGRALEQHL